MGFPTTFASYEDETNHLIQQLAKLDDETLQLVYDLWSRFGDQMYGVVQAVRAFKALQRKEAEQIDAR